MVRAIAIKSLNHYYRSFKGISCYLIIKASSMPTFVVDSLSLRDHMWTLMSNIRAFSESGVRKVIVNGNEF